MRYCSIRATLALIFLAVAISLLPQPVMAQTEVDVYGGLWIPFLPDYNAASIVTPGGGTVIRPNLFSDDQQDAGGQIGIRGFHHFAPTRTMLEIDLNIAGVAEMGSRATFADNDPGSTIWMANLAGSSALSTGDGESATFSLDSSVLNYSEYIGLRDRFNLCEYGIGLIDLGFGFSHMAFEQDHTCDGFFSGGSSGQYVEEVDNHYYGADIRSTIHRVIANHSTQIDLALGIYDLDGNYDGVSIFRNPAGTTIDTARVVDSLNKTAFTADVALRIETCWRGILVRPGIRLKYVSDMVSINHPQTIVPSNPATLSTASAYVLGLNLEMLL